MRLFEEYLSRHNIKTPIVFYENSNLIFRSKETPHHWLSLSVQWSHPRYWEPGYFVFSLKESQFEGDDSYDSFCFKGKERHEVYWDAYEKKLIDIVRLLKKDYNIVGDRGLLLNSYQILVRSFDGVISDMMKDQNLDSNFCNMVEILFDDSQELWKRLEAGEQVLNEISKTTRNPWSRMIKDVFKNHIVPALKSSDWLVSLFKDENYTKQEIQPCSG